MVAVRKKVGARGYIRTQALNKGKRVYKIDVSKPVTDGVWDEPIVTGFEQHFLQNTKLHGKKGKLGDKVKITFDKETNVLQVSTTMRYRKKYFKYLTKKYLKKRQMRDWFRILSTKKDQYQLTYALAQEE